MNQLDCFEEIWLVDTEYTAPAGHRPTPICLVAVEHRTGRQLRLWRFAGGRGLNLLMEGLVRRGSALAKRLRARS